MELTTVWFGLIAVLFTGYFILEGFDFGVGVLARLIGRTEPERRAAIATIGPVWDGNEVWLLTAGGAMFAAFPEWYATLFSGFYLPLLLILVALILRGVAFEYRDKRDEPHWRNRWDNAIFIGSLLPAILWGVAFANIVRGVPLDADHEYTGTLLTLLNPYALLGGTTTTALFVTHGAVFLALKTTGDIRGRANTVAGWTGIGAAALAVAFLTWTLTIRANPTAVGLAVAAALALVAALAANRVRREGWAFTGTATAIGLAVAALFTALFPTVLPSTSDPAGTLTTTNAASTTYTLTIMTWVAALLTPVVLLYQGWTYWVFRRRVSVTDLPTH
ncbi:cytochrome d ubiquinol oxidase subunit II [Solwaraspora sp. WMMD406]|uniref:cytochrome d ubiquinol oxidase subunit II n=1 Tax=Solwaraspora sp. WMMD406 TaxID=3016095 RepID=UPI002417EE70|nr:cytochrome d ubiquinol oxidase subunit II [Solwaraspora sp. WMMD406]MDG4766140.1 cytochrome d ubiquinol oxidase subunit II [Solwaraspora sp. WMMD406]MDG4768680.1 cytochrome d ubiquinol oxidase subunit II [Solwaraspora sp. WMMD406]